jgi:O-antigen ligase
VNAAAETALAAPEASEAGAGARAVRAAYFVFVLWIPIETIDFLNIGGDSKAITLSRLVGLLLFLLALTEWRRCFRRIPAAFWMVAWYLAAYTASQLRIPNALDGVFLNKQAILIYSAVLFLISANLFEDADFRGAVLRFYGWWVSLVAVGMMLGLFGTVYLGIEGRSSILGQDPNVAAGFFATGAVCLAGDPGLFASRRFAARGLATLLAIAALITAIIQTGSRGGLLVFVAGILGLAVCGGKATRKRRALIAGAVIAVFGALLLREFQQGTIAAGRLMNTWTQGDTAGRGAIYDAAWSMFLERPLLGYGGAANFFTLGVRLNHPSGGIYFRDTHNLLLAVLTEVGLVGAVPFVAAIFWALWKAWRHGQRTGDALPFALMCAQIAINTSLTGENQNLFWIVLAAAVACG